LETTMNLPNRAQVDTAARYAGTIAATAFAIFGLQAKGITLEQVQSVIAACGTLVNDIVVLVGALAPLYLAFRGISSSSATAQAAAVAATGAKVVTTPEIAAAVPSPNVMSATDVRIVNK